MGFDVYGITPKNKKGIYFRENLWGWRLLWALASSRGKLTPIQTQGGFVNNGISYADAIKDRILEGVETASKEPKKTRAFIDERLSEYQRVFDRISELTGEKEVSAKKLYPFDLKRLDEFICFLKNNEGFQIK